MNRKYYAAIYLDRDPTPLDMSLLDTKEILNNTNDYTTTILLETDSVTLLETSTEKYFQIANLGLTEEFGNDEPDETWLKIEAIIKSEIGLGSSYLVSELVMPDTVKRNQIRLFSPITKRGSNAEYQFFVKIPEGFRKSEFRLYIHSSNGYKGYTKHLKIIALKK
jgi:hypothetical protein